MDQWWLHKNVFVGKKKFNREGTMIIEIQQQENDQFLLY